MTLYDASGRPLPATRTERSDEGADELAGLSRSARDVEVTRSFAFKLNLGNYESADFFCSQKAPCSASDVESVSADLYEFCIDEVMKSVKDLKRRRAEKEALQAAQRREAGRAA